MPGGTFQLAGVVYRGALLVSSTDVFAWNPASCAVESDILGFLDSHDEAYGDFLLFGTGAALAFPSASFRAEIERRSLGLEAMDTSAACRTYNVLIAEGRKFEAALLPLAHGGASS